MHVNHHRSMHSSWNRKTSPKLGIIYILPLGKAVGGCGRVGWFIFLWKEGEKYDNKVE